MEKIKITTGVYWVDVPEADLCILCGCPEDTVKHLMKRGLIMTKEEGGIAYESGPNAILLSDIPVQNGSFANLAEFPVLQMLYRQGMILPDHPNNTGVKPMLLGSEEQVRAQSRYIHLGNYGLVSAGQIKEAGVANDMADEIMAMKMRFAFGNIKDTEELLDLRFIGESPTEIRNGVFGRRIGLNLYEFSHEGRTVTVDLNLGRGEYYEPPYQLGHHGIEREYFSVIHVGEGDGWDATRPCMGSILTFQGKIFLIDAGPNIQASLTALGISASDIEGIFHTHAHDDHFAGLTTLVRSGRRIKYYSTALVRSSVMRKLSALMSMEESQFNHFFEVHDLGFDAWNNIEGMEVMPLFSPHPVETCIYLFRTLWRTGHKTYAHLADTVALDVLEEMVDDSGEGKGVSRSFFDRIRRNYLTPADLKKIDIGGGLIHGRAEDFQTDASRKIIFSHSARPLTGPEKELGSSATFGMQDILISSQQDYEFQSAFYYFRSYFPEAPIHDVHMLLNCPVVAWNPGSILIKTGTVNDYVYLILRGVVEFIASERGISNALSTGTIVGELSGIMREPTAGTFRAASRVRTLRIPWSIYMGFVMRNQLYPDIRRLHHNRRFLQKTWLFGEMTAYPVQNRIAGRMDTKSFKQGAVIPEDDPANLYILKEGDVRIAVGDRTVETLAVRGFFGEEGLLDVADPHFTARVMQPSKMIVIPGDALMDIPIIRWKLLETYKRRLRLVKAPPGE